MKLTLYGLYTRRQVHDLFDPGTSFSPQAGTWGLWGIIPIPRRPGDYILFVTFGKEQAGYHFDEWITENGIFNWQSQPSQSLSDRHVQQFIHHDSSKNNIYLFLRTNKTNPYTYLGRLAYHSHDPERQNPVWVRWKLLFWPLPKNVLDRMGLILRSDNPPSVSQPYPVHQIAEIPQPISSNVLPTETRSPTETGPVLTSPEDAQVPKKIVKFEWRGKAYSYNEQELLRALHKCVQEGLPEKALDFNKWCMTISGQAISLKWIFQHLTKIGSNQFTTQQARDRLIQSELPIFYIANDRDDWHGCTVRLDYPNLVQEDIHANHQTFAQAFVQKVNADLGNGKLIFPKSQNRFDVHYSLAGLGQGCMREIKNGKLEFTEFEFSFEGVNTRIPFTALLQKINLLLPEAQKQLGYPLYATRLHKRGWRIASEIISINKYSFLAEAIHNSLASKEELWIVNLDGKNIPTRWDQFYKKAKLSNPESHWNDFVDTLYGAELAEFINVVVPVIQQAIQQYLPVHEPDRHPRSEIKMGKRKNFIGSTIRKLTDMILDLAQLGEVGPEVLKSNGLSDSHLLQLVQSGWAITTPYAMVATPRLLNLLPIENLDALNELLYLSNWDYQGWSRFDQKAFHLPATPRFEKLCFDYIYTPKISQFTQDNLWRPVWLVNYMPENDWDDWEISNLMQTYPSRRETKLYVHSALPIQNIYGGIPEAQDAAWKTAFYWLMLQLLILSDPETGAVYDPQISVNLSEGWKDESVVRLFLLDEYIGDLADCLETLLSPFRWVWVNRSGSASQNQQAILGLLRLLLKIDIVELGKDGRVQFTDAYRRQLFESQAKARLYYHGSKEARDQLRDAVKEMS